jgi:competence protein ComEC
LGALGVVAALTLMLDPASLFNAGFQLSYGVVLGLLTLAGPPAERWHARSVTALAAVLPVAWARGESVRVLLGMFVGACISSIVACTVSTPIALWHGGFASTYAAPISVFTMPAAALVTVGGVASMVIDPLWPAAARLAGCVSCACAGFLAWTARVAADWPATCWWIGRPSLWWVAVACVAVALAWRAPTAQVRRMAWLALVLLAALAWWGAARPHAGSPPTGVLRVDVLDVGNGSCFLVRAAGTCVVYDAGTSSDDSAGSRRIVPALAALGVRRIDALLISHVHLEHFSAVPEVVRAFNVQRIVVSAPLKKELERPREDALHTLASWLAARGHSLEAHVAGDDLRVGSVAMHVLGPALRFKSTNRGDCSLVVRVRHVLATHDRAAVLLTGGLLEEGCAALADSPRLAGCASIMELPRHGAWTQQALELAQLVRPSVVLQSVGGARVRRDRWQEALQDAGCSRGVTAFHGALRAEVSPDGVAQLWHWEESAWVGLNQQRALESNDIANR